jgi:hypothetical protein
MLIIRLKLNQKGEKWDGMERRQRMRIPWKEIAPA